MAGSAAAGRGFLIWAVSCTYLSFPHRYGQVTLGSWVTQLTSLRSLGVEAHALRVPQSLSSLSSLTGLRLKAGLGACDLSACAVLPERLESLTLSWEEPAAALPPAVASLRRLRRLQLSHARLAGDGLALLPSLSQLEELAVSGCCCLLMLCCHRCCYRCSAMCLKTVELARPCDAQINECKLPSLPLPLSALTNLRVRR